MKKADTLVTFSLKPKRQTLTYKGVSYAPYTDLSQRESALLRITWIQKTILLSLAFSVIFGLFRNWHGTVVTVLGILTGIYFIDLLFNLFLVIRSFTNDFEIKIDEKEIEKATSNWPTYAVFCPLYREWQVLDQFIQAMENIDYPKDKLQILLLLEQDDKETIQRVQMRQLPDIFKVVIVPHTKPKTKPKALNYGLNMTNAEFVVVYDAEDIPDPLQLKKAVLAFAKTGKETICLQAKLNFYNPKQNLLTRLFTTEYSLWFDLVLTGLQSINAPIPLGGTSNHFRTSDLRLLKGWDPFNVTEDADLGMRLAKKGYKTAIFNSTTMEEANSQVKNWLMQRSRWIKGYMQTYFVHMRKPFDFSFGIRKFHLATFQLVIGGKVLSTLINPLMWLLTIAYFIFRGAIGPTVESFFPTVILYMAGFSLIFGNFLYAYYYMLGTAKRQQWDLVPFALFVPLYWLGMSIAAFIALRELCLRPFYWQKTQHGLHIPGLTQELIVQTEPDLALATQQL